MGPLRFEHRASRLSANRLSLPVSGNSDLARVRLTRQSTFLYCGQYMTLLPVLKVVSFFRSAIMWNVPIA